MLTILWSIARVLIALCVLYVVYCVGITFYIAHQIKPEDDM